MRRQMPHNVFSAQPIHATNPNRKKYSLRIFIGLFLLVLIPSLLYTWLRTEIYESDAILRLKPMSDTNTTPSDASTVLIKSVNSFEQLERAVILSAPIINKLFTLIEQNSSISGLQSKEDLRAMLHVRVTSQNVLELIARGPQAESLPWIINNWIEIYTHKNEENQVASDKGSDKEMVSQIQALEDTLNNKRIELENFRNINNIVSDERKDNRAIVKQNHLSDALSKAQDAEVQSEGNLAALKKSIQMGEPVLRKGDQANITNLQKEELALQEQIERWEEKYTPAYLAFDRKMQSTKENLATVKQKLKEEKELAIESALAEARQNLESAHQTVLRLSQQLKEHKREASEFNTKFIEYSAKQKELNELEDLLKNKKASLAKLNIEGDDNSFKPVTVVSPVEADTPIYPNYSLDTLLSFAAAFITALIGLFLYLFFTRPPKPFMSERQQIFYPVQERFMGHVQGPQDNYLTAEPSYPTLENKPLRELSVGEINDMLEHADTKTRLLLVLILNGLGFDEIKTITWNQIDMESLSVKSDNHQQAIRIPEKYRTEMNELVNTISDSEQLIWMSNSGGTLIEEEFNALISFAGRDAGLHSPGDISQNTLQYTYMIYLLRQGMKFSELLKIFKSLSATELEKYAYLSPPGPAKSRDEVNLLYPSLS